MIQLHDDGNNRLQAISVVAKLLRYCLRSTMMAHIYETCDTSVALKLQLRRKQLKWHNKPSTVAEVSRASVMLKSQQSSTSPSAAKQDLYLALLYLTPIVPNLEHAHLLCKRRRFSCISVNGFNVSTFNSIKISAIAMNAQCQQISSLVTTKSWF